MPKRKRVSLPVLAAGAALAVHAAVAQADTALAQPPLEGFDSFAEEALHIVGTPGAAIAVVQGDRASARAYGVRVVGRPERVDADTLFAIASNTKLFTGTAAALLDHEGILSLEAALTDYLPKLRFADPYVTRNATVLDALAHRTGLAANDMGWMLNPNATREEILTQIEHVPLAQTFRNGWNYSNYMYAAVGMAIQASSGRSWDQVVRERIFQPLGMTRSSTSVAALAGVANVASPHALQRGVTRAIAYHNVDNIAPAGGINSTANDMVRWCRLQVGTGTVDGRRIIEASVIEKTRQPYVARPLETSSEFRMGARHVSYGLGIGRRDFRRDYTLLSHTGAIDGMLSATIIIPEARLCVAVMTNRSPSHELELIMAHRIVEQALAVADPTDWLERLRGKVREARERQLRELAELERGRNHLAEPTHEVDDYVGIYHHALGNMEVRRVGSSLRISAGLRQGNLLHWRYDTFTTDWDGDDPIPQRVTFHLNDDGEVASLTAVLDDAPVRFVRNVAPTTSPSVRP